MTETTHQHHDSGVYIKVLLGLLIITIIGFFVSPLSLPPFLHTFLIILVALMKATLIVAFFMHLKFEKGSLINSILLPILLLLALAVALLYEGAKIVF